MKYRGQRIRTRIAALCNGIGGRITLNVLDFRPLRAVGFLHPRLLGIRAREGFGIIEAMAAVMLFGVGVLGAVALGSGAWRMTQAAALRTAQSRAAAGILDGGWGTPRADLVIGADTFVVAPGLVELRVTVGVGSGAENARTWTTRRLDPNP